MGRKRKSYGLVWSGPVPSVSMPPGCSGGSAPGASLSFSIRGKKETVMPQADDSGKIPRLREALAGGYWGFSATAAANSLEAACPGARRLPAMMWGFHRRAALWAVTEQEHALPAQSVIFTAAGVAPRDDPLHAPAAHASPAARFCYCDGDRGVTLLNRTFLALPSPVRVAAAEADEEDPDGVLSAASAAGVPVDCPVSVHVLIAAQRWPGDLARSILTRYREILEPGSSVCLTLAGIDRSPQGEAFLAAVSAASGRTYRHSREEIAGWIKAAGLIPHPRGVTDARAWGRDQWAADEAEGQAPAVRVMEAVGVVPWQA